MSESKGTVSLSLAVLRAHPLNANVMPEPRFKTLVAHIRRTGRYEPLVVRPDPEHPGRYQLLNGHHRKKALETLGVDKAECVIWEVDDDEAAVLLATLNRLSGKDDPQRRSELLRWLSQRHDHKALLAMLPENKGQLEKRLAIAEPIELVEPSALPAIRRAMTFFVTEDQETMVNRSLQWVRSRIDGDDPDRQLSRGDLLAILAERAVASEDERADVSGDHPKGADGDPKASCEKEPVSGGEAC